MSYEAKGSTPGLIRNNSLSASLHPAVSSPQTAAAAFENEKSCPQLQPRTSAAPAAASAHGPEQGQQPKDEESIFAHDNAFVPVAPAGQGQEPDKENIEYPEGGLRAWLVVFGSFCGMTAGFGYMNTIGIFHAYLGSHQLSQYGEQAIGWVFSVYVFLSFFCGVQIGPVFDAHGPRWILAVGTVCLLLSAFLMGECTGELMLWLFLVDIGWVVLTVDGQSTGTS
jgi:hypothetical protein